jgi:multidrug resistance efflux pump
LFQFVASQLVQKTPGTPPLAAEVKRDQQAVSDHLMPQSMLDHVNEKLDEAKRNAQTAAAATQHLQTQLKDVKSGYVLDANARSPASVEQRDAAAAETEQLAAEKLAVDSQLDELKHQGPAQPLSTPGDNATLVLRSPVAGPVWARSVSPSQTVAAGDDLFRVADDASIHVEVWLDRRYGPQLSVGDTSIIYLGGLGKELRGRVVSFQGTSRRRLDEEVNAIDLQAVHPDQYHVTIELDPVDRKPIYIGQAAKVLFPGGTNQLRAKLYSMLMRY